ncbi:MAG: hypothetical protein SGI87_07145 [Flavobacteriales bacterium]|nr:hypothetical protein [Flavobacteriales bacterium]
MEISECIGRTITLIYRVDSRIPQRINPRCFQCAMRDKLQDRLAR